MVNRYKFIDENKEHLHTLDGKPLLGTTTALQVLSKELTWWASGMAVGHLGWLHKYVDKDGKIPKNDKVRVSEQENERLISAGKKLTEIKGMTIQAYLDLMDDAYKAHNVKKESRAKEGTDLHALAEEWIKYHMGVNPRQNPIPDIKLLPFVTWCDENVKCFLFSEVHCYSERLWVGGKTDFGYESVNGNYVLADIKSRDAVYFSDFVQCGGYDIQLEENGAFDKNGETIINELSRESFSDHAIFGLGENFKEPVISKETHKNRDAFENCVNLYRLKSQWENK